MTDRTARQIAEAGRPIAVCPVDRIACLREICESGLLGPCYKITLEKEKHGGGDD